VRAGHDVRAFVMYNSFNSWGWLDHCGADVKGHFDVFAGDIRDPNGVRAATKGCDAVLHLAALIAIPYSYHSPDTYVDTNIKGTLNIVQAARDLQVRKVIHTSTSEVYGTARFVPITEEHPLQGQSPYSASKIGADQIAMSYYSSFGTPVTIVRPFNTYGPRQSARAVIPTIITQIVNGSRQIKLGALGPTRDFNYVTDTVAGFTAALASERGVGEVINLGGSLEISIGDTIGVAVPSNVADLMGRLREQLPQASLAVHLHDTRGTALANVLAALQVGIDIVDSSAGGLGGCPFAPGASGNLATEDLLFMLHGMGIETGVDLAGVAAASRSLAPALGHPLSSRYLAALKNR